MKALRFIRFADGTYLFINLPFNKTLEVGFQYDKGDEVPRSSLNLSLSFTGRDHAGLRFGVQLRRWFFEFNLCDNRHWYDKAGRWYLPGEEATLRIHDQGPEP